MHTLVVVRDHDWRGRARAYNSPIVIDHLEMDVESDFFAMVSTITRNAHGKDHGPGGEIEFLWAVELE